MSTLIGLTPGEPGWSALDLGKVLARAAGESLVVTVVVPAPWPPAPDQADREYRALQERSAQEALDEARSHIGSDLQAELQVRHAHSVPAGLLEAAHTAGVTRIVLGSSASGLGNRVSLGGVAARILHSCALPVALAPLGYAAPSGGITRITVGFGRADTDSDLLTTAAGLSRSWGAPLRVACFAVRPFALGGTIEPQAEELVVGEWADSLQDDIAAALDSAPDAQPPEVVMGQGGTWEQAMADIGWHAGEVLMIGSTHSAISRVFLGSHAAKIVRNAAVPVILLPRG